MIIFLLLLQTVSVLSITCDPAANNPFTVVEYTYTGSASSQVAAMVYHAGTDSLYSIAF
jgi:hypothetical protein